MVEQWLSDDQQRVWRGYVTMVGRLQAVMNQQLRRDSGLSLTDYDVLVELAERGPSRMFQLADALVWEQSRLSHQLRRMRSRGLVTSHGGGGDGRGVTVELTEAGRAALRAAAPGHVELVRRVVFDGLTAAQLNVLRSWTDTVLDRC
jgi:DNA-binding MarR family transcriptional regulator